MIGRNSIITLLIMAGIIMAASMNALAFEDNIDMKPRAGIFINSGADLDDISFVGGVQFDWDIDDTFNLRIGYEYTQADVSDGSDLKSSRIPLMIVSEIKEDAPLRNVYFGIGAVRTIAQYSDGHYPDVTGWGPALMLGWKLSRHFSAELQWDNLKKYGRNYGGYSLLFTFDSI